MELEENEKYKIDRYDKKRHNGKGRDKFEITKTY